jgi:hypothetical protein
MREEIDLKIKIIRPLYFVENFFFLNEKNYHEISIYYLIEFPPNSKILFESSTFSRRELVIGTEKDPFDKKYFNLIFKWANLDNIENEPLYPLFLRKSLKDIHPFPEHIINHEIDL